MTEAQGSYRKKLMFTLAVVKIVTSPPKDGSDPEYLLSQTTSSMLLAGAVDTEGKWREQSSAK